MAEELTVNLGERSYKIFCGKGRLNETGNIIKKFNLSKPCLVVSNSIVAGYYWNSLQDGLIAAGFRPSLILVPDDEEAKSLSVVQKLYEAALSSGIDRDAAVIALGGGVVGDVAGFAAATWLRGVPLIQVPTTVLAQVDSSVGGKVAVNLPQGKNLIGSFYQPLAVIADQGTLKTLPIREIRAGLAEVIKYGVIADAGFFLYLEEKMDKALAGDMQVLENIVVRCCVIKAEIVALDEREQGLRAVLNFGHTIGHAVETLTGYGEYRHGEAVAIGMAAAARIACRRGMFSGDETERLNRLLQRAGLPIEMPYFHFEELKSVMERDKKNRQGRLRMVLPERLGKVTVKLVEWEEILEAMEPGQGGK